MDCRFYQCRNCGNENSFATGINEIHKVKKAILFLLIIQSIMIPVQQRATFIIINKTEVPAGKTLFIVDDPFEAYLKIVIIFAFTLQKK